MPSSALRWHMPVYFVCMCVSVAEHIESLIVPLCDGCIAAVVQGLGRETEDKCRRVPLWHPHCTLKSGTVCVLVRVHFVREEMMVLLGHFKGSSSW